MTERTHTPDRETVNDEGRTVTTITLKRCCNGCGIPLGDADDRDVDDSGNLTDVRGECPNCRPLVEAEAAGCQTWHLLLRDLTEDRFTELRRLAKPHREPDENGRPVFCGIALPGGSDSAPMVARFGDWIIRHPDGGFTVHKAPAADTPATTPDGVPSA